MTIWDFICIVSNAFMTFNMHEIDSSLAPNFLSKQIWEELFENSFEKNIDVDN